jgi:bifunctional DNA-binding transcriptional regulator/antitoxin component of YhaV-PrlF toxin-antitoxin module
MLVRIHYDGWLALPPTVCRRLGLRTGDQLEVEPREDGVFLRHGKRVAETMPRDEPPAIAASERQVKLAKPPARPSKTQPLATKKPRAGAALLSLSKARGKRSQADENGEEAAHPS